MADVQVFGQHLFDRVAAPITERERESYASLVGGASTIKIQSAYSRNSWWRGTVVERRSLTGELTLSCDRPAADG